MKRLLLLLFLLPSIVLAQGGRISQDPWVSNRQGFPIGGTSIAICQPLATTAASLASTIATFTMASNPITAGFKSGMVVQIAGFTAADTYFNQGTLTNGFLTNGVPIILVTATQIIVGPIAHANGTAGTNGTLLQLGNSVTSCAGLSTIYTDASLVTTQSNPLTADGLGNYGGGAVPGVYYTQLYGSGITTTMRQMVVPCVPTSSCAGGGGGGGTPGTPLNSVQLNVGGVFTGAVGIFSPDGNNLEIKGPDPFIDVTAYGARPLTSAPTTTASCNGTTAITLAAASTFINGDGVVIYGCGATETMTTPSAPTVTPGISNTLTVPDAQLTTLTGATTYSYKLVSRDKFGGLTVPSTVTTIATGLASLGKQQLTVTSATIAGNTMTVVMSGGENLAAGELVHIVGGTNNATRGWYNISSITNGTTFVIKNLPIYAAAGVTSTGGTLTYFAGNQLTWTNAGVNLWESIICASRPADGGAYHIIGLSYPVASVAYGSTTTFTDWGATVTSKPVLPSYITDSACTAGSVTNDYLSTTISSGAGSTSVVVANAASQTIAGQTFLYDAAPNIKAAAVAATTGNNYTGVLFFPWTSTGVYYFINSFLDLTPYNNPVLAIREEGILYLNETFLPTNYWYGFTAAQGRNASTATTPVIAVNTAWPGVYYTNPTPYAKSLTFNYTGSNQALLMLIDGTGNPEGMDLNNINFSTGSTNDYSGIGLVIRPAPFSFTIENSTYNGGQAGNPDNTWTPLLYLARDTSNASGDGSVAQWTMQNMKFFGRTIYNLGYGGVLGEDELNTDYIQGAIMPSIVLQNLNGAQGMAFKESNITNDTSLEADIAILGGNGTINVDLALQQMAPKSQDGGGFPFNITGVAPKSLSGLDNLGYFTGPTVNPYPTTVPMNSEMFDGLCYYANDYQDAGNFGICRGIKQYANPVTSISKIFVPLGIASLGVPSASAGGTIPNGAHTYCVQPVGQNGGWGVSSCQTLTIGGGNQTLDFSWTSVPGVIGYVISQDGNNCLPTANANCAGVTTATGVTTLHYTGGGANTQPISTMTAAGDGVTGMNAAGIWAIILSALTSVKVGLTPPSTVCGTASGVICFGGGTVPCVPTAGQACIRYDLTSDQLLFTLDGLAESPLTGGIGAPIDLITQTAAIGATTLINSTLRTSTYRICFSADITVVASTGAATSTLGGTNGFQVIYTSPTDSVAKTTTSMTGWTSAANTTATAVGGCMDVYAKIATSIQFKFDYTSNTANQMTYEMHVREEDGQN